MFERLTLWDDANKCWVEDHSRDTREWKNGHTACMNRLAAYEDSGLTPEQVQEFAQAKAEGRLFIIPDGYEYAKEFYHVVNAPLWCVEDGWGCEDCPYEEEVGNITDCKFKPYVSRLKPNTVLKAMYVLRNLFLSKEAAEKALGGGE